MEGMMMIMTLQGIGIVSILPRRRPARVWWVMMLRVMAVHVGDRS
jgi:hypothetical protein